MEMPLTATDSHHSEPTKKPQKKNVSTSYSFSEKLLNKIIQHIGFFVGCCFGMVVSHPFASFFKKIPHQLAYQGPWAERRPPKATVGEGFGEVCETLRTFRRLTTPENERISPQQRSIEKIFQTSKHHEIQGGTASFQES